MGDWARTISGMSPRILAASHGPHQKLGQGIDDDGNQEQRQADLDQGGEIYIPGCLAELIGQDAGHGLAGSKQRLGDLWTISDHHEDGHGLAERAPQPENDAANDSGARVAQHADANHLPTRCAQRQNTL